MTRDFLGALESGLIGAFSAAIAFALYRWGEKPLGAGVQLALWFAAVCLAAGFGGISVKLFLGLE
jgi:hypothetical protein